MATSERPRDRRRAGFIGGCFFTAVLGGSMAFLAVTLIGECGAGREALDAYVATIEAGDDVSAEIGGAEASAITDAPAWSERPGPPDGNHCSFTPFT